MTARVIDLTTEILDLLGGISVAPELVGRERLESLQKKIATRADSIRAVELFRRATSMYGSEDPRLYKPVAWAGFGIAILLTLVEVIFGFLLKRIGVEWILLRLLLSPILLVLFYWAWLLVLTVGVFIIEIILDAGLSLALWVVKRAPLSRTMLVLGFVLFVLSRLIKIVWLSFS